MTLVLHRGGVEVDYAALRDLPLPEATSSHVPIAHWRVVDLVRHSLTYYGHEIIDEHHAIAEEGMRYFGLLTLRSPYGNYTDTLGLRGGFHNYLRLSLPDLRPCCAAAHVWNIRQGQLHWISGSSILSPR